MPVSKVIYSGETLIDLTKDTVAPETLAKGVTAHDMAGNPITGTMEGGGVTAGKSYRLMVKAGSRVYSLQQFFNVFSGLIGLVFATQEVIVDALPEEDVLLGLEILPFYIVTGGGTPSVYVGTEVALSDFVNEVGDMGGEIFSVLAPYNGIANSEEEMTSNGTWLLIQDENQVVTEYGNGAYVALDGMKFRTIDMLPQVKELDISQSTNFNSPDVSLGIVADEGRHLQVVAVKNSRAGKTYDITRNGTYGGLLGYDEVYVNVPTPTITLESKTVTVRAEIGEYVIEPSDGYDGLGKVTVTCRDRMTTFISGNEVYITQQDLYGYTKIRDYAFANSQLTGIEIPNSIRSIGSHAFYKCSILSDLIIPDSVTDIGTYAFSGVSAPSITLSRGIISINESSFEGATISSIKIYNSVTYISNSAFRDCTSLTSVTFEENSQLVSIAYAAFYGCIRLTSITIPDSVTDIYDNAFTRCTQLTSVTIGSGLSDLRRFVFLGCSKLKSFSVNENNTRYKALDGNLYSYNTLVQYAIGKTATEFTVPSSCSHIGDAAFYGCDSLTSVTLHDYVYDIAYQSFAFCNNLTTINIGSGVKSIGSQAFINSHNITTINYNGTKEEWEAIDKGAGWMTNSSDYTVHCTDGDIAKANA